MNHRHIPAFTCLFCLLLCRMVWGDPADDNISWLVLETRHTRLQYQSVTDLERFNHKIKYRKETFSLKRLFEEAKSQDLEGRVMEKLDALFERVQYILDMHRKMDKVKINLYKNPRQLHNTYQNIYKQPCRIRAWYEYRYNTVYLNLNDVHEGMVAHELAHGIIDHYLLVRPPPATAEILARYVDAHLKR